MPVLSLEVEGASHNRPQASGGGSDPLDRFAERILRIHPFSWMAVVVAVFALISGAALQALIVFTAGSGIPFAGFFPAIAFAAIVAGAPAGIGVAVASLFLVVWAVWEPHFVFEATAKQSTQIAWLCISACILVGLGLVCRTLLERAHKRQKAFNLLVRELEHRRANTFLVLNAVTRRTISNKDEAQTLLRRFEAIRRTNDLLTRQPEGALLTSVLRDEFQGITPEQVEMHGADVMLPADLVRNVMLIIHELVTNAVKYGALSKPTGALRIEWEQVGGEFALRWEEVGGPAPTLNVKGFGTKLIEQCVTSMRGSWEPTFTPSGFRCLLSFPLQKP